MASITLWEFLVTRLMCKIGKELHDLVIVDSLSLLRQMIESWRSPGRGQRCRYGSARDSSKDLGTWTKAANHNPHPAELLCLMLGDEGVEKIFTQYRLMMQRRSSRSGCGIFALPATLECLRCVPLLQSPTFYTTVCCASF